MAPNRLTALGSRSCRLSLSVMKSRIARHSLECGLAARIVIDETLDGQISDVWSGDGSKILREGRKKSAVERPASEQIEFETPERLKLYRPTRSFRMKSDR